MKETGVVHTRNTMQRRVLIRRLLLAAAVVLGTSACGSPAGSDPGSPSVAAGTTDPPGRAAATGSTGTLAVGDTTFTFRISR
jgi:hypothetical protein